MLTANKSSWFENVFAIYNRNLFNRRFASFQIAGLDLLANRNTQIPLILYANHSSWWDGLTAFQISHKCRLDSYIMMEEKNLKKTILFTKLGAFSVVRENPKQAMQSVNYAADLLQNNRNRVLWIFPQGEILPNDVRPLKFFNGLSRIIKKIGSCETAAVAMRYEFRGKFKPEVFVKIARLEFRDDHTVENHKLLTESLSANLTAALNELKSDVINSETDNYLNII